MRKIETIDAAARSEKAGVLDEEDEFQDIGNFEANDDDMENASYTTSEKPELTVAQGKKRALEPILVSSDSDFSSTEGAGSPLSDSENSDDSEDDRGPSAAQIIATVDFTDPPENAEEPELQLWSESQLNKGLQSKSQLLAALPTSTAQSTRSRREAQKLTKKAASQQAVDARETNEKAQRKAMATRSKAEREAKKQAKLIAPRKKNVSQLTDAMTLMSSSS